MSLIETIAKGLGAAKKTPSGFVCRCPCHEDREASLSLKLTEKGGIILNCFAGCKWEDIKAEIERRGLLERKQARKSKYDGAVFYIYKDQVGNVLCRKVKLPDKKMWFERLENGVFVSGLNKLVIPLYNIEAVASADLVYLCEGEKDAESLITRGLCATTNHAGATAWSDHLSEQLRDKIVIVIPDNDDAGRKRVKILTRKLAGIVRELRLFTPPGVPDHGDITDWLNAGGDAAQILPHSTAIDKKSDPKHASFDDYVELFEEILNSPRKCIFNEKLMTLDSATGLWNPAINQIDILKSHALCKNETRTSKFNISYISHHLALFEARKPLEFLVDVPEWDGRDRISEMAYMIRLKEKAGVSENSLSELLKEWCGTVFRRLWNPMVQNRILVLQGPQGIGKDSWTSLLVDGLGQFSVPLAVIKDDKDTYLNLHRGLVMKISEFDKTARAEVSTLKDIITAPSTNLRAPYDRDSKMRMSRCSFISSANVESFLRDYTGNRRYLIFELESIAYPYESWSESEIKQWQIQCLAEMHALAEMRYQASAESWTEMHRYIDGKTPEDPIDELVDQFEYKLRQELSFDPLTPEILSSDPRVLTILAALSKDLGIKPRGLKTMLQGRIGVYKRYGSKRVWALRVRNGNSEDDGAVM